MGSAPMSVHDHSLFTSEAAPPANPLELPSLRGGYPRCGELPLPAPCPPKLAGGQGNLIYPPLPDPNSPAAGDAAGDEPATCAAAAGAPLLPGLDAGGSLASVLQCRLEMIEAGEHAPGKDGEPRIASFLNYVLHEIHGRVAAVLDDHRGRAGLAQLRRRLVKLAALIFAVIDRIDAEPCQLELDA